jgi:GDP-mannose 6-dehydrogenase
LDTSASLPWRPSFATAAAGEPPGTRYEIAYSPEFTREGTALADYFAPARIMVGEGRPRSRQILLDLHPGIEAPIFSTSFEVAEFTKLGDNSFHALKVAFGNEIGRLALSSSISPSEVFDIFQADTKLNLSSAHGACAKKRERLKGKIGELHGDLVAGVKPDLDEERASASTAASASP